MLDICFLSVDSVIIISVLISIGPRIIIRLEAIFINNLLILTGFGSARDVIELLLLKSEEVILIKLVLYLTYAWGLQHLLILLQTSLLL